MKNLVHLASLNQGFKIWGCFHIKPELAIFATVMPQFVIDTLICNKVSPNV